MAHTQSYRCPDCGEIFDHFHHPDDSPPPDRCPLCGAWVASAPRAFRPRAPGIRKNAYAKSVEATYRAIEQSSAARAEMMAERFGGSVADYGAMKITNMKDPSEMREGDVAAYAPPVSRETRELMAMTRNVTGHQQNAQNFAQAAHSGPGPHYIGDYTRKETVAQHHTQMRDMVAGGTLGRADREGNIR